MRDALVQNPVGHLVAYSRRDELRSLLRAHRRLVRRLLAEPESEESVHGPISRAISNAWDAALGVDLAKAAVRSASPGLRSMLLGSAVHAARGRAWRFVLEATRDADPRVRLNVSSA